MAWTAPMTAASNAIFTSAQFNTYVRDNLLETATAKASTAGGYFVATGTNALAQRTSGTATTATSQSTASTSYTNLTTTGPAVTATTGTRALVLFSALMGNTTTDSYSAASVGVTGASTITADDTWCISSDGLTGSNYLRYTGAKLFTTLSAGSNTFTMKYRAGSGTAVFADREIIVLPL